MTFVNSCGEQRGVQYIQDNEYYPLPQPIHAAPAEEEDDFTAALMIGYAQFNASQVAGL